MRIYKNVMELLVEEKVQKQFESLPGRIASNINPKDLIAYTLNQLPPLYATTTEGIDHQLRKGRAEYSAQIARTLHVALVKIQQDISQNNQPRNATQPLLQRAAERPNILHHNLPPKPAPPTSTPLKLAAKTNEEVLPKNPPAPAKPSGLQRIKNQRSQINDWFSTLDEMTTAKPPDEQDLAAHSEGNNALPNSHEVAQLSSGQSLEEQLVQLRQGAVVWNQWRAERSNIALHFSQANLSGIDLSGVDLDASDLSQADLIGTNLANAYLEGSNLSHAYLKGANLSGAYLNRAKMKAASLSAANLQNATLQGADLEGAYLRDANLSGADLSGANLSGADLSKTNLSGADLSGADLSETNLSNANLSGARLSGANLNRARCKGGNLCEADLSNSQALSTNFSGAKLTGARLGNWSVDSTTKFEWAVCDYVWLDAKQENRYPHEGHFPPGEFSKLFASFSSLPF